MKKLDGKKAPKAKDDSESGSDVKSMARKALKELDGDDDNTDSKGEKADDEVTALAKKAMGKLTSGGKVSSDVKSMAKKALAKMNKDGSFIASPTVGELTEKVLSDNEPEADSVSILARRALHKMEQHDAGSAKPIISEED